jgi:ethanolamine utilization protein EutN
MFIAKITGSLISTQKVDSMKGQKLLVVEPYRINEDQTQMKTTGRTLVAVDTVGAGENEFVLVVQGSSARNTPETKTLPVDATIIGIVDSIHAGKQKIGMPGR